MNSLGLLHFCRVFRLFAFGTHFHLIVVAPEVRQQEGDEQSDACDEKRIPKVRRDPVFRIDVRGQPNDRADNAPHVDMEKPGKEAADCTTDAGADKGTAITQRNPINGRFSNAAKGRYGCRIAQFFYFWLFRFDRYSESRPSLSNDGHTHDR